MPLVRSSPSTPAVDLFGPIGETLAAKGGHPLSTVVHELGHIIGIGHGGPYNGDINLQVQQFSEYDTMLWTLMSYIRPETTGTKFFNSYPVKGTSWGQTEETRGEDDFLFNNEPLTPMMLDILAVQRLYGVATSGPLTGGGHTFGFNSNIAGYIGRFYDFKINTTTPSSRSGRTAGTTRSTCRTSRRMRSWT